MTSLEGQAHREDQIKAATQPRADAFRKPP